MSAYTSGFQKTPGGWEWPEDLQTEELKPESESVQPETERPETREPEPAPSPPTDAGDRVPREERHYPPRTCRICLETVLPTFHEPLEHLPDILKGRPTVSYDSDGGRLIRPCKCKGSSKYVHESCLQEWRHADPSYGRRNYWNCPTCGFQYRLGRMTWASWISSTATQIVLTLIIFMSAIFLLGFVADPIIDMYLDPYGATLGSIYDPPDDDYYYAVEDTSWAEHFLKGFASLGFLGAIKVLFGGLGWVRFFMRSSGRGTGRDRMNNFAWPVIIIGIITFVYTVWKIVRAWSRRMLEKASERVLDVQGDDDD